MFRPRLVLPLLIRAHVDAVRADDAEDAAVALVKKFNGIYVRNDKVDGKPITIVNMAGAKKFTDADLKILVAGCPQVNDLNFSKCMITERA